MPSKPKKASKSSVIGRPTLYKAEYVERAAEMCQNGATVAELAGAFEVSIPTVYLWMNTYVPFFKAVTINRGAPDERVKRSLYHRAVGYDFETEKIFMFEGDPVRVPTRQHVPPDTNAAQFWLKNRQPEDWKDRQEIVSRTEGPKSAEERRQEFLNFIIEYGLQDEISKLLPTKLIEGVVNGKDK